jgi:MurNAc alpha-1-phosphate uridylyltransferase
MADSLASPGRAGALAAVILAAGAGARLRPLTDLLPKPMCPVGNVMLIDDAIARSHAAIPVDAIAVNVHHHRAQLEAHLEANHPTVYVSVEAHEALGTAGALAHLRRWLAGRPALVINADTWCRPDLAGFVADWDAARVRLLVVGHRPFGPRTAIVASLIPWAIIERLEPVPSGLYEVCWRREAAAGRLRTVAYDGPFVDCGTPAQYLQANREAARLATGDTDGSIIDPSVVMAESVEVQASVIGAGARISGSVQRSVVWPGAEVYRSERLDRAIRTADGTTVLVR